MSKPELVDIVQAGIKIQQNLSAARLAQAQQQQKAEEDAAAKSAVEKSRREAQHVADVTEELAERWAMLEQFHPEERLAEVNNIPGISWGGTADITKRDSDGDGIVGYALSYVYSRLYQQQDDELAGARTVLGDFNTSITIGIGRSGSFEKYPTGPYYHGGYGLFVREQDASLSPIALADTFKDLTPKTLRQDLSDSYTPHIVVIDVDHPQAGDMLAELLARSSIRRFGVRMGETPISEMPTPNRGFWSRIFG